MLDHVGFTVGDYERSKTFYEQALRRGPTFLMEPVAGVAGLARARAVLLADTRVSAAPKAIHVAFAAETREEVDAFHAAALEAGGTDNGVPGIREIYHPSYYGAYVLDPDGTTSSRCHRPE